MISVITTAARSAPRSEPANNQARLPRAVAGLFCPYHRAGSKDSLQVARALRASGAALYGEMRSGTDVVVVEGEPGAAIVVAAWMLDPTVCAAMQIGAPHVSVEALADLHRLLLEHGLDEAPQTTRTSSRRLSMRNALQPTMRFKRPRQLSIALDSVELRGTTAAERSTVLSRLARLLTEAAGVEVKEAGDDER